MSWRRTNCYCNSTVCCRWCGLSAEVNSSVYPFDLLIPKRSKEIERGESDRQTDRQRQWETNDLADSLLMSSPYRTMLVCIHMILSHQRRMNEWMPADGVTRYTNRFPVSLFYHSCIVMARQKAVELTTIWKDKNVTSALKIRVMKLMVWAVFQYGVEGWTLKEIG